MRELCTITVVMTQNERTPRDNLDNFADTQTDPYLTRVFEKIKLYNDLLLEQAVSQDQIYEIMNELDNDWRQLMNETTIVTAAVSFVDENSSESTSVEVRSEFYEEHEMIFGGVLPVRVGLEMAEGSLYQLELRLTREGLTSSGNIVMMLGSAKISEIASIEFPDMMSIERARKWLEYYNFEEFEDINVSLFEPSTEECEMVLKLKDIEINTVVSADKDHAHSTRTMQALNIYTNSLFDFDSDAPYGLTLDGEAWSSDSDGTLSRSYCSGATMSAIDRVVWLPKDDDHEHILTPHLAARFLGTTKDDSDTEIFVPICVVQQLRSYRYSFFTGYSD